MLTLAGFWLAYQFVDPAPPSSITIATGQPTGAYYLFAQRYQEILARNRIALNIRNTSGSKDNLALLNDPQAGIEIAFVQSGVAEQDAGTASASSLSGLASLYFEPLWLFHRLDSDAERLTALRGKRIAMGSDGSGTQAVALQLFKANDITSSNTDLAPLGGQAALDALLSGERDAMFIIASPRSTMVRTLLATEGLQLMHFERAAAYTRNYRFLSSVTLPQGSLDLTHNTPDRDLTLLAPVATLVANDKLHPALATLLLEAVTEVHGSGGLFEHPGQFPTSNYLEFPLNPEAQRYFESGPPFLQRHIPFWAATLIDRLLVMLFPLIALFLPFLRILPPMYKWRMRYRIYRWYRELLAIRPVKVDEVSVLDHTEQLRELDRIEDEVIKVSVPLSYADQLYNLRMHIELVREQVKKAQLKPDSALRD
ncbi:MAG: C4-dicarboxylate ABC transporter substrate-binding protein [Candidatus Entotheonella factor]|uniref:C4-dicarboxylate ABC transporter substrate-binding protein n=1 Tax=Entotheonella factor TaxID=1429438 RepID=W4LJX9_ENTF1|nr:TAXI family TRAP transporter solute-binding subunit [Candidatus Entotheonella palauensis]ETW98010.1 MAG: C4-dicarboxylate ABC transporter substrate-binding protein [Candidatus Entotheonella factor]